MEKGRALRQRLEQLITRTITAPSSAEAAVVSLEEVRQALHELEVHQVELEIKNEELHRMQMQFDDSRTRYFDIYDLAPVGYATVNEQERILEANFIATTLLGMARQALINQPISHFIFKEDQEIYARHQQQLLATGEAQTCELRVVRPDTTVLWVRLDTIAAQNGSGDPISRVILTDITESKLVVEALRASEGKFRSLAESSHDHIVLYDKQYRHRYMNPAALDFAGLREDALIGEPPGQGGFFKDLLRPVLQEKISQVFMTAAPYRMELEWNSSQGLKYFDWRLTPVFDAEGRVCSVLGVSRDITERKQVEELKLDMERKFQQSQKLESLGVLAGGLAHDFNNILAIILGQCDILSEDLCSGIDQITQVKQIEKAALRAVDLCRQMLTYVGKNAPIQTRINLRLIVEETVKLFRSTLQTKVRLELDFNEEVFEITGDRAQIQQVIMDLYFNAAEAIGERKGTISIALNKKTVQGGADIDFLGNAIQAGDYACLTVSDNGCGMDAETRKRIFEPFYTTKYTGRGLGLSAALGIVTAHDGALQFSTTPGIGSTFKVFFPLLAVPGIVSAVPAADISQEKDRGTLLLVDDEPPLRIIGSALLKAMGFTVMTAAGGREAIKIHRENSPKIDLILLDLLMPEMGGIETYRLLRQISSTLPIVICSEGDTGDFAQDITNDPFAEAVQKPYKPDQLRKIFMKLIETME